MKVLTSVLLFTALIGIALLQSGCTLFGAAMGAAIGGREGARRGLEAGAHVDAAIVTAAVTSERVRRERRRRRPRMHQLTYRCEPPKQQGPARIYQAEHRIDAVSACYEHFGADCDCERTR